MFHTDFDTVQVRPEKSSPSERGPVAFSEGGIAGLFGVSALPLRLLLECRTDQDFRRRNFDELDLCATA
jgi:hypothetical protein